MSFSEKIIKYPEWRDIILSDEKYLYTGLHIEPFLNKDKKFSIIYYKDEPIIGYQIRILKKGMFRLLKIHYDGLPYLGFVVYSRKIFRDIDFYMNLVDYMARYTLLGKNTLVYVKNPLYFYDPRGFLWRKWMIRTEYTYISYPRELDLNKFRKIRRREYKKAVKEGYTIESIDFNEYVRYYLDFAMKKGFYKKAGIEVISRMKTDKKILEKTVITVARTSKGIGAGELFLIDEYSKTAYRLFPFSTEYGRKTGAPTFLVYNIISELLSDLPYIVMLGGMQPALSRFVQDFSQELRFFFSITNINNNFIKMFVKPLLWRKGFI